QLLYHSLFTGLNSIAPNKSVAVGIGFYFCSIHISIFQTYQTFFCKQQNDLFKYIFEHCRYLVAPETVDSIMIRLAVATQPNKSYIAFDGFFYLATAVSVGDAGIDNCLK